MNVSAAAAGISLTPGHRRMVTGVVVLASILQTLDTTIANVALPHMQGTLSASQDQMSWVITSYIVASAVVIPLSGWLSDHIGRKRVMLFSIIGFTLSSALCGMAESIDQIVLFRLLQGFSGAALIPLSQAILFDIYPAEQRTRAMTLWAVGVVLAPLLGPILGGFLTDNYSWRWVFFINVPLGLLATLGVLLFFRRQHVSQSRKFDFFGFVTLSVAVGAFQLMLDRGTQQDWFDSTEIRLEAAVAAFAFYLFVVQTFTASHPFVRVSIFKDRNFVLGTLLMVACSVIVYATLTLMPALLQNLMGYSVLDAGLLTSPRGLGSVVAMIALGSLLRWVGPRTVIAAGFLMAAQALWVMMHFPLIMGMSVIFWTSLIQGIGTSIMYVPITTLSFATLPPQWRNEATAIYSLLRNLAVSVGVSVFQTLLVRNTQVQHAVLAEHLTPYRVYQLQHGLSHVPYHHSSLRSLDGAVTASANMTAYDDAFKLMLIIALVILPVLLLVKKSDSTPPLPTDVPIE